VCIRNIFQPASKPFPTAVASSQPGKIPNKHFRGSGPPFDQGIKGRPPRYPRPSPRPPTSKARSRGPLCSTLRVSVSVGQKRPHPASGRTKIDHATRPRVTEGVVSPGGLVSGKEPGDAFGTPRRTDRLPPEGHTRRLRQLFWHRIDQSQENPGGSAPRRDQAKA